MTTKEDTKTNPYFLPSPPFTIKELRDSIPAHCFERSFIKSFSYIIFDVVLASILYYFSSFIDYAPLWIQFILWPTFWFIQGSVLTGLWVIGHECGHQSFSNSQLINNAFGFVIHSFLLVPYHAWRITHSQHHKSTSHMDRDTVFVPPTKEKTNDFFNDIPILNLFQLIMMWIVGWPGYLIFNVASQEFSRRANHFEPSSPLFKDHERHLIVWSDLGLIGVIGFFVWMSQTFGFAFWLKYYFMPYLIVNFWLVTITYLQHSDPVIPHYRGEEWSFIRGALATVDRDYGIFNYLHHHIGDSHVAHHLFSTMPHYHAIEATPCLKKFLGKYYIEEKENVAESLWRNWNSCHWVESTGNVVYYKNNKMIKSK